METKEHLDQTAGENNNQSENSTSTGNTSVSNEENVNMEKKEPENQQTTEESAANENVETKKEAVDDESLEEAAQKAIASVQDDQAELVDEENGHGENTDGVEIHDYTDQELEKMTREETIIALEDTVRGENVAAMKVNVANLRNAFNKHTEKIREQQLKEFVEQGGAEEAFSYERDNLDIRFNGAYGIYREKRAKFQEALEAQKVDNLARKNEILEQLKELINSEEPLKTTYDKFQEIQGQWKAIGMVPRTEVNNLWQNYHFLVEKFFDKVRISRELKDLGMKKHLEQKVALCEEAEKLIVSESVSESFKELQVLHEKWKEIGPVPSEQKEQIWERFKAATDKVNQRRRDYYAKLREKQQENYDIKTKLCEAAEEIINQDNPNVKDWQQNTDKIQKLLSDWKKVGQAPKKLNDEIWERFKSSLDTFFGGKKQFFAELKDQQVNNHNQKIELCIKAEALKGSTDWKNTTRALIKLQEEWKKIGPVPKKHSDKVWKRFRSACDCFFNAKEEHFKDIHQHEGENLKLKKELVAKIVAYELSNVKNEDLENLKAFQKEWMEIGHVPFAEKDKLMKEYRDAIDEKFNKLKISNMEKSAMNFMSKFESVKDNPDGSRRIGREKNVIMNRIKKMEEDIKLWENNIGFLASSKNADILKQEFERKIKKAKDDMKLLKQKLRILDNMD